MVGRHDLVTIDGKQHDCSVDHVGEPSGAKELAGGPAEGLIEGTDVDPSERLRQAGLPRAPSPHLPEHARVGQWNVTVELRSLEASPHRPLIAVERNQGAAVENEAHADFVLRGAC